MVAGCGRRSLGVASVMVRSRMGAVAGDWDCQRRVEWLPRLRSALTSRRSVVLFQPALHIRVFAGFCQRVCQTAAAPPVVAYAVGAGPSPRWPLPSRVNKSWA
jgi:hypothetical protein